MTETELNVTVEVTPGAVKIDFGQTVKTVELPANFARKFADEVHQKAYEAIQALGHTDYLSCDLALPIIQDMKLMVRCLRGDPNIVGRDGHFWQVRHFLKDQQLAEKIADGNIDDEVNLFLDWVDSLPNKP